MQQITSNIYQISLGSVNTFLIDDNGLTLIDSGSKIMLIKYLRL
jgi:hypothetical protein